MSEVWWTALALALQWIAWRYCAWFYRRIHGVGLKWWAVPFAQGALIFTTRLPAQWELPAAGGRHD